MTLEKMRESFLAAEGLGAAAVMVRLPQALALLAVASAAHGAVSGPDLWEATDLHLINVAKDLREALAKLKEAGVTI